MSYVGKQYDTNEGYIATVVEYINCTNVYVRFDNNPPIRATMGNLRKGKVKNPYHPSVCSLGYIGVGEYKTTKKGSKTKAYQTWKDMLRRCSDRMGNPTYADCLVCEEWHNFQNFAKWHEDNHYEIEGEQMHLDKDILVKGNKIYSPETCIFVPRLLNELFVKKNANRGDLPIGVSFSKGKYLAKCSNPFQKNNQVSLGYYDTAEEAFDSYKKYKEGIIKEMAYRYKDKVPQRLFEALLHYKVEIVD